MGDSPTDRLLDSVIGGSLHAPEATPSLDLLRTEFRDPDGLAEEMVRRQWITPFQAERLLAGRQDDLVLGPYALLEPLGEGGMGRVYKARHRLMNRVVALKVIRTELLASAEAKIRFQREIEAAARVWHPNLVAALDALPVNDGLVLVMEYVEGETLARIIERDGPAPIRHACDWARQAALGLAHAHEQGLIHRDVKPSNLMLVSRGSTIKVTDLGLARLDLIGDRDTLEGGPLTDSNAVVGTPDYMSPEQAVSPREATARSDIYSLGCTLYHLLTGRPPFPGGSLTQKLLWHQTAEPTDPAKFRASLPPGLAPLVARMMAKRPEQRYATAADVAQALEPFCSAATLKTLPVETVRPPEIEISSASAVRTPTVHHEPQEDLPYDLVGAPGETEKESIPDEEQAAPPLKTDPKDESWWKEEVLQARKATTKKAAAATPPPSTKVSGSRHDLAPKRESASIRTLAMVALVTTGLLIVVAAILVFMGS